MSHADRLTRTLSRERRARKQAEAIAERTTRELYQANLSLKELNEALEERVRERTVALRVERDKATAATLAKSRFLASMSHELRTPLNVVVGLSETLAEEAQDLEQRDSAEPLRRIKSAALHLLSLINGILDLSKIEAGHIELHPEDVDLATLLTDVVSTARPIAKQNGNRLTLQCSPEIGVTLRTDPMRLRQVLINIVGNACKFTTDGEIHVTVEQCPSEISIAVADTGIGIAEGKLATLFDEFSQADTSVHRRHVGTGLGLAISRRLCHLLGGDIAVRSALGQGTTFTINLPR